MVPVIIVVAELKSRQLSHCGERVVGWGVPSVLCVLFVQDLAVAMETREEVSTPATPAAHGAAMTAAMTSPQPGMKACYDSPAVPQLGALIEQLNLSPETKARNLNAGRPPHTPLRRDLCHVPREQHFPPILL